MSASHSLDPSPSSTEHPLTLIVCPSCGRSYSGAAAACSICGFPTDASSAIAEASGAPVSYVIVREGDEKATSIDPSTLSFFPVATHKFIVMSFFTFGLYELYWCYKNWARIEARTSRGRSPLLRAIFAPISSFWLFPEIHRTLEREYVQAQWQPWLQAALYLALSLTGRLPNGWWALSMLSFAAFVPVVRSIQTLHMQESGGAVPNSRYSTANICAIAFGTLLLLLILAGALLPDPNGQ